MWQSDDIIRVTAGIPEGRPFEASSVSIDSRTAAPAALFVAIKGERVDGHDYLKEALARGAAGAIVHRSNMEIPAGLPVIGVEDTLAALVKLGEFARARAQAKVIAVTGSVGKTGAKEAIRLAVQSAGKVYATQGNLNNHIGLPLSLANLPPDAKIGVFELGMNHAGEIAYLSRMARPDIAVITTVEAVHLEFFPDVAAIADAKAEIIEGMNADGTLILNRDNAFYERLRGHARTQKVIAFGAHDGADCRLLDYRVQGMGSEVEAVVHGQRLAYTLGTIGRHYAYTSLAALAAASAAGVDVAQAAKTLAEFREPEGRGKIRYVALQQGAVTLIDDCYNASPASMKAGLARLAELHAALGKKGRKIAVMGDMLELGKRSGEWHRELLAPLKEYGVHQVFAAGTLMRQLYDTLPAAMQGGYAATAQLLAEVMPASLKADDVVLIKGSRGSRMDTVRAALCATSHNAEEPVHAV